MTIVLNQKRDTQLGHPCILRLKRVFSSLVIYALVSCSWVGGVEYASAEKDGASAKYLLDLDKLRDEGMKYYEQNNYKLAQKSFIQLVQHQSTSSKDYLSLARAAYYAEDFLVSSVAYQIYFELDKKGRSSAAQREYSEVKRQLEGGVEIRKRKSHKNRLEDILKLIKEGAIGGERGALSELIAAHKAGIFDPLLDRAHKKLESVLHQSSTPILWRALQGRLSADELKERIKLLTQWSEQTWGGRGEVEPEVIALQIIQQLDRQPELALQGLEELNQLTTDIPVEWMKDVQLLALIALGKSEEIYLMTDGMIQNIDGRIQVDDAQKELLKRREVLSVVRASYSMKRKSENVSHHMIDALSSPPRKLTEALKGSQPQPATP